MNDLLQVDFRSPEQIDAAQRAEQEHRRAIEDALGAQLYGKWQEWRDARRDKEDEWLEDLRAYNGIYEPDVAQAISKGRSDVYVHLTRTKCLAAYTRIVDLLFQSSDKHWSIAPTPIPTGKVFLDPLGRPLPPRWAAARAEEIAQAMEQEMEDQLTEADYDLAIKTAIAEACILGSGAVKGVTVGIETDTAWGQTPSGWVIVATERAVPAISPVSIFDLYPDPYADRIDTADGCFQRHILTRSQLRQIAERFNFDEIATAEVLSAHPNGNYYQEHHEIERRRIAGFSAEIGRNGRFEVLEYWGMVRGDQLESCGCRIEDRLADYQANVWTCGSRTLHAKLNPSRPERLPYAIFPYERVPHQFWGTGVARQMRDSQQTMNAAVRAMLDNLAISSGPLVEVNLDLLAPGEDPKDLHPWRVFLRERGDPSYPLLRFYQVQNVAQNLTQVVEMFRRFADEETSLPSYTHGEAMPGLNKTATGMSMLMTQAAITIKGTIKNIDDYLIAPVLRSLYDWNMRWNPREDIKGDLNVVARGSTTLIAREVQSQRLMQFMQMTANPLYAPLVKRPELLREVAQSLDIDADKMIATDEQLQAAATPQPAPIPLRGGPGLVPGQPPGMGGPIGLPDPATGAIA